MLSFCSSTEALRLQSEAFRSKRGHRAAQLEELQNSLEQWNGVAVAVGQQGDAETQGVYLHTRRSVALTEPTESTQAAEESDPRRVSS